MLEREILFALILTTKTIDIRVNLFYLMRGFHIRCFFPLKLHKETYMSLVRFFVLG